MDLKSLLLGSEDWSFLPEALLRSVIMFLIILMSLRLLGKRGISQLSVFELGVIIGLGSAAGDPMFYKDVGLLPSLLVFVVVVSLYRLITHLINSSQRVEHFVEGRASVIIDDGRFQVNTFKNEPIAHDELFAQLRNQGVSHLGQVEHAIVETNGKLSLFFYPDEKVQPGLPILPKLSNKKYQRPPDEGMYACSFCGHTVEHAGRSARPCGECGNGEWVKAIDTLRVR